MNKLIPLFLSVLFLTGCIGSDNDGDSSPDKNASPNTTSTETCDDVALGQTRRNKAFLTSLGVEFQHTAALGVWRFPVTNGQSLTATMEVPDDKDYQMALFDTNGNKLACSDNAGFGTPESMTYEVNNLTMVWLKVWTSASPSNSAATIVVSTPVVSVPTDINEQEPNNTIETAQEIGVAHSRITGSVDYENSDADDFFVVAVAEGNVVTVTAQVTSDFDADLIYIALTDGQEVELSDGENPLSFYFDENALSTTLTYTVPASVSEVYVRMAGLPGAADYELEIRVHGAN